MEKYLTASAAILLLSSSVHAATDISFTGLWLETYGGKTSYTVASDDHSINATLTATYKGYESKVSGLDLEGVGVLTSVSTAYAAGGIASERPIDNNETLTVTFDQTVDLKYVVLDRWEALDIATVTTDTGVNLSLNGDNNVWIGDETKYLGLMGINSISFTAANGWTSFFLEGFTDVEISQVSDVPVPAAAWLFGSALAGLLANKKK